MTHARLTQNQMFDWIERCIDGGTPLPTDDAIMDHFILPSVESARTLLASLADAGRITIKGWGPTRRITLGKAQVAAVSLERPIRSARKPVLSEAQEIDKVMTGIKAILARGKAAVGPVVKTPRKSVPVAPTPTSPPRPETTGEEPGTTDTTKRLRVTPTPEGRADTSEQASDRQVGASPAVKPPHPVMAELEQIPPEVVAELSKPALEMIRMPTTPSRKLPVRRVVDRKRQVSFWLSGEVFDQMEVEARALDIATGTYVRRLVEISAVRPRIPAKVATAAMRAGVPVIQFAAEMMERGLAAHLVDQAQERVA